MVTCQPACLSSCAHTFLIASCLYLTGPVARLGQCHVHPAGGRKGAEWWLVCPGMQEPAARARGPDGYEALCDRLRSTRKCRVVFETKSRLTAA
eukprot:2766372-Amphidinium_carterae.2